MEEAAAVTRVCLDTTVLSDAIREKPDAMRALFDLERRVETLVTASHNIFEAAVGALRLGPTAKGIQIFAKLRRLIDTVEVLPFDLDAALDAARTSAVLHEKGRAAPMMDLLTAASARKGGCTAILTRNVDDFRRIGALEILGY